MLFLPERKTDFLECCFFCRRGKQTSGVLLFLCGRETRAADGCIVIKIRYNLYAYFLKRIAIHGVQKLHTPTRPWRNWQTRRI